MRSKLKKTSILLFLILVFFSCAKNQELMGRWENDDKTLIINPDKTFEIQYKKTENVKGFYGTCVYSKSRLILNFKEYKNAENKIISLAGTELESYIERITFQIINGTLKMRIENTGKIIEYTSIPIY